MQRHARQALAQFEQPAILRAEVVSPVADAVRLVDRDGADVQLRQTRHKAARDRSLGRDEQQAEFALFESAVCFFDLVVGVVGVQGGRRVAVEREPVDLVLHERDQRTDDERELARDHRRELVAEALAPAGGQDDE